jgi:hypothetical protein
MADYRLYCLDGDGRISLAEWIQADSDEEAIGRARELHSRVLECEIWRNDRLVATIKGGELAA